MEISMKNYGWISFVIICAIGIMMSPVEEVVAVLILGVIAVAISFTAVIVTMNYMLHIAKNIWEQFWAFVAGVALALAVPAAVLISIGISLNVMGIAVIGTKLLEVQLPTSVGILPILGYTLAVTYFGIIVPAAKMVPPKLKLEFAV